MHFKIISVKPNLGLNLVIFGALCLCSIFGYSESYRIDNNPYRHKEVLGLKGEYILEWIVDLQEKRVTFNVTVEGAKGFIGLGFNRDPVMDKADVVVGSVMPDGKPYFSDRHIVGRRLEVDRNQDYVLHEASETKTHTFLRFSRSFDTCDEGDDVEFQISGALTSIIWAYGEEDEVGYHFQNRGTFDAYILDPDLVPREIKESPPFGDYEDGNVANFGNWKVWTLAKSEAIPSDDTAYLCSMHKAPKHDRKQHIIGYRTVLEGETERRHIHHYLVHRCRPPPGVNANEFFGPWLSSPREVCYVSYLPPESRSSKMPYHYCQEVVHVWGVGGMPIFYPSHVGQPMLEDSPDEYFVLQVHYDNPDRLTGLNARFALEVFYTENLRKHDAGLILTGTSVPGSPTIMIPPSSTNYNIYGHCGSRCTDQIFPRNGINIFAVFHHTHLAGRGLVSNHLRGGRHLPPYLHDDNYNFNFQQIRTLNEERNVLPGDSIIIRCTYETTDRNGSVTVGGFATRNEMCSSIALYYPYIRSGVHGLCASEQKSKVYDDFLGIHNKTWSDEEREFVVTAPLKNAGLLVSEVGNNLEWTRERRRRLYEMQRTLPQATQCPDQVPGGEMYEFESVYVENEDDVRAIREDDRNNICGVSEKQRKSG